MNLRQLLKNAGISNDIAKEVVRKSKKISQQTELEHHEKAMAMTKMLLNDALRYRKEHGGDKQAIEQMRTIIIPDEK